MRGSHRFVSINPASALSNYGDVVLLAAQVDGLRIPAMDMEAQLEEEHLVPPNF